VVAKVARQFDLASTLIYAWRRQATGMAMHKNVGFSGDIWIYGVFHALTQSGEKPVQLLERLAHSTGAPGSDGSVERFLRGIKVPHDDERLATPFFKRHRGDRASFSCFIIRPNEARVRRHFDVPAKERHWLL
jgi:hypothetical protein